MSSGEQEEKVPGEVLEETEEKEESEEPQEEQKEETEQSEEKESEENVQEEEPDKPLTEMTLREVLKINQQTIDFGNSFPGQISEETIIILNNMKKTKVQFQIKINCLSTEFDDLEEYVYSMRRPSQNE